jgi:hypothetical protein
MSYGVCRKYAKHGDRKRKLGKATTYNLLHTTYFLLHPIPEGNEQSKNREENNKQDVLITLNRRHSGHGSSERELDLSSLNIQTDLSITDLFNNGFV